MALVGSTQPIEMLENKGKELNENNDPTFNFSSKCYSANFSPGKKGGTFDLDVGGKLIIPEGVMNKKDSITCGVIPPDIRYAYAPKLSIDERLHSEIFKLEIPINQLKNPILLQIAYEEIDNRLYELNAQGLWSDEEEWVNVGFLIKQDEGQKVVELTLHQGGVFVVTYLPKKEKFELTPNGSLYTSRLCRFCTVRCPRKAVETTVSCSLKVIPVPPEKVAYCQETYPFKCADLLDCVEIVDVSSSQIDDFRRPLTIKMPVPNESNQPNEKESEEVQDYEIAVVTKIPSDSEWNVLESTKISRRMVSFDVKRLGKFCVVKVKEGRFRRMKEAVAVLEDKIYKVAGCISLFTSFEDKIWTAAIACYPRKEAHYYEKEWEKQNFKKVNPLAKKEPEKTTYFDIPGKRFEYFKYNDPEFYDGLSWTIRVEGNLKLLNENDCRIVYYSTLKDNFYIFKIEPEYDTIRQLIAQVNVSPDGIKDEEERSKLTGLFTLNIKVEQVDAYFYVEPEEEEEIKKLPKKKPSLKRTVSFPPIVTAKEPSKSKKSPGSTKARKYSMTSDPMERLTKSVRKTNIIIRESRVLSGRSLMYLSKAVPNGLNLAIHLGLSESCITGLGFDALANGLNMSDITYKILLYWKRHQVDKYDVAVNQLALAFQQIGLTQVSNIIINQHNEGNEINKDCFAFMDI